MLVGAAAAFIGAIIAARYLPARAPAGQGMPAPAPAPTVEPDVEAIALAEVDR